MPRPLRIEYEGACYHIISRGNAGDFLYVSNDDKEYFLKLLGRGAAKYRVEVYAYCILGTHYHLLIQTLEANLSDFMHFLGSSYGSYLSRKGRIGHVFAGRYKAICVEKEEYLLVVSRYIHLNPVKAGIVSNPEDYPWSSYPLVIADRAVPPWLNTEWVVEYFGPGEKEARAQYRGFIRVVEEDPPPYPNEDVVAQTILGSEGFVNKIKSIVMKETKPDEVIGKKALTGQFTLAGLYEAVRCCYGLSDLKIRFGEERKPSMKARKAFIYVAREHTPASNAEIAEMLKDITPNGVSHQYTRARRELRDDGDMKPKFVDELRGIMSHVRG